MSSEDLPNIRKWHEDRDDETIPATFEEAGFTEEILGRLAARGLEVSAVDRLPDESGRIEPRIRLKRGSVAHRFVRSHLFEEDFAVKFNEFYDEAQHADDETFHDTFHEYFDD